MAGRSGARQRSAATVCAAYDIGQLTVSIIDELRSQADANHNSACLLSRLECTCRHDRRSRELMQDAAMRLENVLAEIDYALALLAPPDRVHSYITSARRTLLQIR